MRVVVYDITKIDFINKYFDYQLIKSCIFKKNYKHGYNQVVF